MPWGVWRGLAPLTTVSLLSVSQSANLARAAQCFVLTRPRAGVGSAQFMFYPILSSLSLGIEHSLALTALDVDVLCR